MVVLVISLFRKGIFEEYSEITSLLTDEIVKVHKEIHTSIDQIDPASEYDSFIDVYRYVKELMNTKLSSCSRTYHYYFFLGHQNAKNLM